MHALLMRVQRIARAFRRLRGARMMRTWPAALFAVDPAVASASMSVICAVNGYVPGLPDFADDEDALAAKLSDGDRDLRILKVSVRKPIVQLALDRAQCQTGGLHPSDQWEIDRAVCFDQEFSRDVAFAEDREPPARPVLRRRNRRRQRMQLERRRMVSGRRAGACEIAATEDR